MELMQLFWKDQNRLIFKFKKDEEEREKFIPENVKNINIKYELLKKEKRAQYIIQEPFLISIKNLYFSANIITFSIKLGRLYDLNNLQINIIRLTVFYYSGNKEDIFVNKVFQLSEISYNDDNFIEITEEELVYETKTRYYKGVSIFIVDMKTPGITIRPLINILNHHSFNEVFFDDVRIPKENLVGQKNNGWYQLMIALDFERSSIGYAATNQRIIEELIKYAKETTRNGEPLANDPLIRNELAQLAVENEVARMMAYRIAWMFSKSLHPSYESSMSMVFISEVMRHTANAGVRILGHYGELDRDSKWTVMNARIMRMCLSSLSIGVGGGSNEIQRNIIAMRGLGLPRK